MKNIFFFFLFFGTVVALNVSVESGIPNTLTAGSLYELEYTICANTPQNVSIQFNMSNTSYDFVGEEFNFSNCSHVANTTIYECNRSLDVGNNSIKINMGISLLIMNENYTIGGLVLHTDKPSGLCYSPPFVASSPPGPSYSGGGSSGGGFSPPGSPSSTLPTPTQEEQEEIIDEPTEEPPPNQTQEVEEPKEPQPQETTPPQEEPKPKPKHEYLEFVPSDKPKTNSFENLFVVFDEKKIEIVVAILSFVVVVGSLGYGAWYVLWGKKI